MQFQLMFAFMGGVCYIYKQYDLQNFVIFFNLMTDFQNLNDHFDCLHQLYLSDHTILYSRSPYNNHLHCRQRTHRYNVLTLPEDTAVQCTHSARGHTGTMYSLCQRTHRYTVLTLPEDTPVHCTHSDRWHTGTLYSLCQRTHRYNV
jgi:hypothetical protein